MNSTCTGVIVGNYKAGKATVAHAFARSKAPAKDAGSHHLPRFMQDELRASRLVGTQSVNIFGTPIDFGRMPNTRAKHIRLREANFYILVAAHKDIVDNQYAGELSLVHYENDINRVHKQHCPKLVIGIVEGKGTPCAPHRKMGAYAAKLGATYVVLNKYDLQTRVNAELQRLDDAIMKTVAAAQAMDTSARPPVGSESVLMQNFISAGTMPYDFPIQQQAPYPMQPFSFAAAPPPVVFPSLSLSAQVPQQASLPFPLQPIQTLAPQPAPQLPPQPASFPFQVAPAPAHVPVPTRHIPLPLPSSQPSPRPAVRYVPPSARVHQPPPAPTTPIPRSVRAYVPAPASVTPVPPHAPALLAIASPPLPASQSPLKRQKLSSDDVFKRDLAAAIDESMKKSTSANKIHTPNAA